MKDKAHGEQVGQKMTDQGRVDLEAAFMAVRDSDDPESSLRSLSAVLGDRVVEVAVRLAQDDRVDVRRAAVEFLGLGESREAMERLVAMLRDPDADVRLQARSALAEHGGQTVVDVLLEKLRKEQRDLVPVALDILGTILEHQGPLYVTRHRVRVSDLVAAMAEFLGHSSAVVRVEAARALSKGGRMAEPALAALAERLTDPDYRVRATVIAALAGIGSREAQLLLEQIAMPRLLEDLTEGSPEQRAAAANAARHVGALAVPLLVDALRTADDRLRFAIMLSLRRLEAEGHGVVRALLVFVNDDDPGMRRNVLYTLQDLATPEALEVVRMARLDVVEDPLDRVLRLMETWARRDRTIRFGPYRLSYGELLKPGSESASWPVGTSAGEPHAESLADPVLEPQDLTVRQHVEEVLAHFGERLSEYACWDVTFEQGAQLEGLLLQPVPMDEIRSDSSSRRSMEVVFERATGEMVLVIGGD